MNLLDLTVKELIENYCLVMSLECDYVYGIASHKDMTKIESEYNLEENLSFCPESILDEDILLDKEPLSIEDMYKILDCLGVELKNG